MKDSISIFRKLINLQFIGTESILIPIGKYDDSVITSGKIILGSSRTYRLFRLVDISQDFNIGVEDFEDLSMMDDSSLILSCGKGIVDTKLLEKYNSIWKDSNLPSLKYKDFSVFLNL